MIIAENGLLTLDYWRDEVSYQGITLPSGSIGCAALNISDDVVEELKQICQPLQAAIDAIMKMQLNLEHLTPTGDSILQILELLQREKAFPLLDYPYYRKRVRQIFTAENMKNAVGYVELTASDPADAIDDPFVRGRGLLTVLLFCAQLPDTLAMFKIGLLPFAQALHESDRTAEDYAVVSVNYALAPDYPYPVPVRQLEQCLTYLKDHAAEYRIDMDRIVFAGSSAGAQIAGQYLNVLTDPAYASEMGLTPPIPADAAIAFVSSSGLLDCERFDKTGVPPFDQVLLRCGLAYFGTTALKGEAPVLQAGVIRHMTAQFPPMFLSDGNTMTFTDQAIDMKAKADALGIPAEILLFPKEEAELRHGFELTQIPQALEVQKASAAFLLRILSREGTRET